MKHEGNVLYKHDQTDHDGEKAEYCFEPIKFFRDPLTRQINEGVRINQSLADEQCTLVNSRAEWVARHGPESRNRTRPTWIKTIDKHDSHKRENLRHINNQLTRQQNPVTLVNSRAEFIQGTVPRPTWINTIDKHDSHKPENFRHIDDQLTRQYNLFIRRGRDAETSKRRDNKTQRRRQEHKQDNNKEERKRNNHNHVLCFRLVCANGK